MTHPTPAVPSLLQKRPGLGAFAALALLSLVAGCAGGPPRHPPGHDEPRQPPLEAQAGFFADNIRAVAQVGGFGVPFHGPGDSPGREGGTGGRPPPGGGMGGMGHGHGGGGPGGEGGHGRSGGPNGHDNASAGEPRPALRAMEAMPRQTLRITLTNVGAEPAAFAITELRSAIGNFQPQPDRLQLAPGAGATLDPVSGDAGGALEWLDVTLTLRRGETTETRVLHLTRVPGAQAAPPSLPSNP